MSRESVRTNILSPVKGPGLRHCLIRGQTWTPFAQHAHDACEHQHCDFAALSGALFRRMIGIESGGPRLPTSRRRGGGGAQEPQGSLAHRGERCAPRIGSVDGLGKLLQHGVHRSGTGVVVG